MKGVNFLLFIAFNTFSSTYVLLFYVILWALSEEASIHTVEMTALKQQKREDIRWVIYRLIEVNAGHREHQRKSPNTKSDI